MVEDSVMQKFSSQQVSVAGVEIWNSGDSAIGAYIAETGATFPIGQNGGQVDNLYGVIANSMVVIDQNGVVQFVQQLGTSTVSYAQMRGMVSGAASTVRGLLSTKTVVPARTVKTVAFGAPWMVGRFTVSGREFPSSGSVARQPCVSARGFSRR